MGQNPEQLATKYSTRPRSNATGNLFLVITHIFE